MRSINIHEAKTHLSRLVDMAAQGEGFIIAKAGKPLVKVIPLESADVLPRPRIGFLAGRITVPEDFDRMETEKIAGMFEGDA